MRVLFLGTGAFGEPALRAIAKSRHKLVGLVTQPDRGGTGKHTSVPPMKAAAEKFNLPVFQPPRVNVADSLERLREFKADAYVVAAYGQILSEKLLAIPPKGAFNLHASLLPKFRGAAPIHAAIRGGEEETGVTIFQIVRELDAGPVLGAEATAIGRFETAGELHDRLARLAAPLTLEVLDALERGTAVPVRQDHDLATYAPQMEKAEGQIDWTRSAGAVSRHVRGMSPWPGAFSIFEPGGLQTKGGKPARCVFESVDTVPGDGSRPGEASDRGGDLVVACGSGAVRVRSIKPAGKRSMSGAEFLRGRGAGRFVS
ncbi:methionyl-tRNA formyltransferase [Alienimonas californiensis]|uniref:Methionyl-tRNA formyltransferase n=1 Tax=Alienimonas californiensis TaxID=2527989 RepID=A0A517P974_9PLAN|nr:methionyl-tRNA formyltransferase [Alienimonas californiensis]QDT15924.1 Methionyl-tRNA formyltransferase [Alienimonas californiensis]